MSVASTEGLAQPASAPTTSAIEAEALSKTYPNGTVALRGLSLEVAEGEVFGLLGPNGAGKSTTIGILTTLVRPTSGTARVAGRDVARDPLGTRSRIGVVFQNSVLDNEFTVAENLWLHARLWGMPRAQVEQRIGSLVDRLGLSDRVDDGVRTLSGGLRRRVEIVRGLLASPQVLFLDEPTVGLDPTVRAEIWRLIGDLREHEGVTVILTTHHLEEAESVCDRVGILHEGTLVARDRPDVLIDTLGRWVVELRVTGTADDVLADLARLAAGGQRPLLSGGVVSVASHLPREELAATVTQLQARWPAITAAAVRPTTLSDVYHHLTGAPASDQETGR